MCEVSIGLDRHLRNNRTSSKRLNLSKRGCGLVNNLYFDVCRAHDNDVCHEPGTVFIYGIPHLHTVGVT